MYKKIITAIILITMVTANTLAQEQPKINLNGTILETTAFIYNDRTYVPMRAIFEALGGAVEWNGETQEAVGTVDGIEVKFGIGSNVFTVNGVEYEKDSAPILYNDRTFVPVRFISESVGAVVWWNDEEQTVYITRHSDGSGMI